MMFGEAPSEEQSEQVEEVLEDEEGNLWIEDKDGNLIPYELPDD